MKLDNINLGSIWTMIAGTALAIIYMFNTFVTAGEFQEYVTEEYYDSYYALLDRQTDAIENGQVELAEEFGRRLEKLKAKICEEDSEWERCESID